MTTTRGSIDLKTALKAHNDAEKVATNYIMDHTDNATYFHAEDNNFNPLSGDAVKITDKVDIIRSGVSVAEFGSIARIGDENNSHISTDLDSIDFYSTLNDLIGYINATKAYFPILEATEALNLFDIYSLRKTPGGSFGIYLR